MKFDVCLTILNKCDARFKCWRFRITPVGFSTSGFQVRENEEALKCNDEIFDLSKVLIYTISKSDDEEKCKNISANN